MQKMVAGWNELTEIAAHIGNSNALLGAALLGTVVRHTGLSPEEAMAKTVDLVESDWGQFTQRPIGRHRGACARRLALDGVDLGPRRLVRHVST